MKIAILTLNEYADVQHILNIAIGLKEKGHTVNMCAGKFLKKVADEYKIEFFNSPVDITEITHELEEAGEFEYINRKKLDIHAYTRKYMKDKYKMLLNQFFITAKDAHIIVYDTNAVGALDIAEYMGIPAVHIANMPNIYPTSKYPYSDWTNKSIINKPFNKLTYKKVRMIDKELIGVINKFRKNMLKIPTRKAGKRFYKLRNWDIPIIYPYAPEFMEEVKDLGEQVHITGFNSIQKNIKENNDLTTFLDAGSKPIIVNFGLIPFEDPELVMEKLLNILFKTNGRYVFVVGNSNIDLPNHPNIFLIKNTRAKGLFEKCKGIIHSGEMLYTADALYYGIPQFIIPNTKQQKFWSDYLYKQQYTLKPMYESKLTTKTLEEAVAQFDDEKVLQKCKELQETFNRTEGVEGSIYVIEKAMQSWIDKFSENK